MFKVEKLAQRQGALNTSVVYGKKSLGSLKEVLNGIKRGTLPLSPSEITNLETKLSRLERLCFDFNQLSCLDLSQELPFSSSIPSTEITTTVKILRNNVLEQPYFLVTFHYGVSSESEIGRLLLVYEPSSKSLRVYTCAHLKIKEGEGLYSELIPKAFLTASKILHLMSIPVEYAYAFYILWGEDFTDRHSGLLRPSVQERVDRIEHIFSQLGFEKGLPPGAEENLDSNYAMMIRLSDLERKFEENHWKWSYERRFGEFAELLDKKEIERRLREREAELRKTIQDKVRYWRGEDGALKILEKENPSEEELLSVILDDQISPEVLSQIFTKLLVGRTISRKTKEKILEAFKDPGVIFNVSLLSDERLEDLFWSYLPNCAKFALLKSPQFPWEIKKVIIFKIGDFGAPGLLSDPRVIEEIRQVLRGFSKEQIEELKLLLPKAPRNKEVLKVYSDLLRDASRAIEEQI